MWKGKNDSWSEGNLNARGGKVRKHAHTTVHSWDFTQALSYDAFHVHTNTHTHSWKIF